MAIPERVAAGLLAGAGLTLVLAGRWATGLAGPDGSGGGAVGLLAAPRELLGVSFPTGELLGLALIALTAGVLLVRARRGPAGRPVAPEMGFGSFRPSRPADAAASHGSDAARLGPVLDQLALEARACSRRAVASVVAALVVLDRTSAADRAWYPGAVWEGGYPYVLAGSAGFLLAAGTLALAAARARGRRGRLAAAVAAEPEEASLEWDLEPLDLERASGRGPGRVAWTLVLLAVGLYAAAGLTPFVPALAEPWLPWSALGTAATVPAGR